MNDNRALQLRRGRLALLMVMLLVLADFGMSAARAEPAEVNIDETGIRQAFVDLGVEESVHDGLIEKLKAGESLDSDTEVAPIAETQVTSGGVVQSRAVYADGSVSVTTVGSESAVAVAPGVAGMEQPQVAPMSVRGCQAIPNSGGWIRRVNCVIKFDSATFGFGFVGDYSVKTGAGRIDRVSKRDDWYYNRLPTRELMARDLKLGRKLSTSSMYAWAHSWHTTKIASVTTTRYLEFRVKGSAWSATWTR